MATAVGRLGLKVLACIASFVYSCDNDDDNGDNGDNGDDDDDDDSVT